LISFTKWEGLGNDFVFLAGPPHPQADALARKLCHRHLGIGADGLVFLDQPPRMVLFNADGSRAQMCGNALRCIGAQLGQVGVWLEVATDSGPRRLCLGSDGQVCVDMGQPTGMTSESGGTRLSMGNPHLVLLDADPDPSRGRWLSESLDVNVEFVSKREDGSLDCWVYERGVGPTLACGTGACAALVVATLAGWVSGPTAVHLPGGRLLIEWERPQDRVLMTGPARKVFEGVFDVEPSSL
jgi:diaminopimelate epimerase